MCWVKLLLVGTCYLVLFIRKALTGFQYLSILGVDASSCYLMVGAKLTFGKGNYMNN